MRTGSRQSTRRLAASALLLLAGGALHSCAPREGRTLEAIAGHYRAHRDYASLAGLIPALKLGMDRQDVEKLLGRPEYSPTDGQYYYGSDKCDADGLPMTLIVEYRVSEYTGDDIRTRMTNQLQSFTFGPVGE